jgi:hypothetical protein
MAKNTRKRLIVDWNVQGTLVLRFLSYWLCCFVTVTSMLIAWRLCVDDPSRPVSLSYDEVWFQFGPAALATLVLTPLVVLDLVRLTSRFVGPIFRLRRMLGELARGEKVPYLTFRDGDYWQEIAADFNKIADKLQAKSSEVAVVEDLTIV